MMIGPLPSGSCFFSFRPANFTAETESTFKR